MAVIGRLAAVPNTGDAGSSNTRPSYVITPLQGLQEELAGQGEIIYDDGSDPARAAQTAREADVAVIVAGYTHQDEGEYISPDTMNELSKNFPPPTPEEMPIAQAMTANIDATNSVANAMPPGGWRR